MDHDAASSAFRLGDLLLARGLLTESELDAAVRVRDETRQRLGEVLLQRGLISSDQLQRTLRRQVLLRQAVMAGAVAIAPVAMAQAESRSGGERPSSRIEASAAAHPDAEDWQQVLNGRPYAAQLESFSYRMGALSPTEPARELQFTFGRSGMFTQFNPLRGELKGGVAASERGLRYRVKLSRDRVRLAASFQF